MNDKQSMYLVPNGHYDEWQSFMAPGYEFVWEDGKIGRYEFKRDPSKIETKELLFRTKMAIKKVNEYLEELKKAKKILEKLNHVL